MTTTPITPITSTEVELMIKRLFAVAEILSQAKIQPNIQDKRHRDKRKNHNPKE